MIQAVIFDMDGTMVHTEELWGEINLDLGHTYGVEFDDIVRAKMMGRKDHDSLSVFKEYYGLEESVEELIRLRRELILKDIRSVTVNPGLFELLDLLEKKKCKKAVATGSFRKFAEKILGEFDLRHRFPVLVTGDDVKEGKPHPEIFLTAAMELDVLPENVLVLEDAENGVEAAYRAGMKVVAIPHELSKHHDFSKATRVLTSLLEVDEPLLRSLGQSLK